MKRFCIVGMTLLVVASVNCGDDSPGVGTAGGPCRADGTCDGNLVCLSNLCVDPSTCTPGATEPCQCQTGVEGVSTCDGSGLWGPCVCAGTCGDAVVDPGEECDDGNNESGDGCSANCLIELCGDGVVNGGEECDDGNNESGDGCSANCLIEACGNGVCDLIENPTTCPQDCPPTEKVDVLFVIDNSGSMMEEQVAIASQISSFIASLESVTSGLPDLHIGVTSTDLGTGQFSITYCDNPPEGDAGRLLTNDCTAPTGAPYIVNVAPTGCTIDRDQSGQCTSHDCTQSNCTPDTTLETDAHGCPRCTNHQGELLEDVFSCVAQLGIMGCGFEQPLEAMRKALDPSNTYNAGFLRPDSVLAVFFLTDEDDCSASTPQLFDDTQTDINSPLGPLSSFRCFEFGVTCNVNDRTTMGVRENCQPREDPDALLYPVSEYVSFLAGLRDPGRIVVAAAAGPVANQSVTVTTNPNGEPELGYSCTNGDGGAVPGIRLQAMVKHFVDPLDLGWAFSPICSLDYSGALFSFAQEIRSRL